MMSRYSRVRLPHEALFTFTPSMSSMTCLPLMPRTVGLPPEWVDETVTPACSSSRSARPEGFVRRMASALITCTARLVSNVRSGVRSTE